MAHEVEDRFERAAADGEGLVGDGEAVGTLGARVYVADFHPGARVNIQTAAYPNETFTARVDRLAATLDPDKHTLAVRCVLPNADGRLKPGMFASVTLQSPSNR